MKALITGGAGFVGTNLALKLMEDGENQLLITDSLGRRGSEVNLATLEDAFVNLSPTEPEKLKELFREKIFKKAEIEDIPALIHQFQPEIVYHFAAQVAVTDSVSSPRRDFKINAEGSLNIALATRDVGAKAIYTSTNKVFGDNVNKVPIKKFDTRYDFDGDLEKKGIPESFSIDAPHHTPYGVSKLVGELYVREFGGVANRCSCMYGPNQNGIVDQGWMSHIARQILSEEQVTIYGDGKQIRDVLHSDDVVDLLLKQTRELMVGNSLEGQVFNVGGGYENTISLLELTSRWGLKKEDLRFEDWRPADQRVFYCDTSKAQEYFGWEPKVTMEKGVDELYQWTKENMSA